MWLPVPGANPFSSPYVAFRKAMVILRSEATKIYNLSPADGETSYPNLSPADGETSYPNLSPADGETSYPNLSPAGGETQRGGSSQFKSRRLNSYPFPRPDLTNKNACTTLHMSAQPPKRLPSAQQ